MKNFYITIFTFAVSMIGCGANPDQVGETMAIHDGYYQMQSDSNQYLEFHHDGTGRKLSVFRNPADSFIFVFNWHTTEWSNGSESLEWLSYKCYSGGKWTSSQTNFAADIKSVSDTDFYVCNAGADWCRANPNNNSYWDYYVKTRQP